jgi:NitT/TauT family transport system substrate-binding protein
VPLLAAPRPAAANDALTIMAGAIAPPLSAVLSIVAEGAGFFAMQHVDVVEQLANSPSVAAQLVGTGKGDICSLSYEAVLQGYEKGLHLEYFFTISPRLSNVLAVLDTSPIRTLGDFKGKNVGVINLGSAGEVTAQLMLEGAGLARTDVTYSPIGVGPQALDAIVNKRVDAIAYPYAEIVPLELLANFHMRVWRHPILKNVPAAGFAATPATIANKADALKRFSRAIAMAAVFVHANRAAAAQMFLQYAGGKYTEADVQRKAEAFRLLQDDIPYIDPRTGRIGALSLPMMQLYAQALADFGVTSTVVPVNEIATNAFIDYANDFDHQAVVTRAKNTHAEST